MEFQTLQQFLKVSSKGTTNPFRFPAEIMTTIIEEVREVAQEVALLERIGSKAGWEKQPSTERLGEEITHLLNVIVTLANFYQINLDALYAKQWQEPSSNKIKILTHL